ncbi:MAG: hypothetical protein PUC12_05470 [Clostridiales bacterium]|nr:hypothetical protein [Clostridiales bacterium]
MEQNKNYLAVLVDALEKKKDALQNILQITQEQAELAKAETYQEEAMEKTLNAKEVELSRVNTLDEGFQSVFDRIRSEVKRNQELYKDEIARLQELIRQCTELGNEIMVLEERNRNQFSALFAKSKKDYSVSRTKANVAQNYLRTMNNTKILDAYFVDKKQ